MGWSIGYDTTWDRDIGYGVPAQCDQPGCEVQIDRGLGFICGGGLASDLDGCELFFCIEHGGGTQCERCYAGEEPFEPTVDVTKWIEHKLSDGTWAKWRNDNPGHVEHYRRLLASRAELAAQGADPT